jgi:hypothetical protein
MAFFSLFTPGGVCLCLESVSALSVSSYVTLRPHQRLWNKDPVQKLLVKRASADNTTKWFKFTKRVLARHDNMCKVIVCYAHATGAACSL